MSSVEALREEVRQDLLKSDDDRAALLADRVRDLEDESVADLIVDTDLADTDRDLQELQDVEGALTRLSQGGYGTCVKCGAAIPFERLQAYPTAKRCQPCQDNAREDLRAEGDADLVTARVTRVHRGDASVSQENPPRVDIFTERGHRVRRVTVSRGPGMVC